MTSGLHQADLEHLREQAQRDGGDAVDLCVEMVRRQITTPDHDNEDESCAPEPTLCRLLRGENATEIVFDGAKAPATELAEKWCDGHDGDPPGTPRPCEREQGCFVGFWTSRPWVVPGYRVLGGNGPQNGT